MEQGRIQVYTGDGKGKSTAAIGLAVRAAGHGVRVFIGQFLKGRESGELSTLERIPEIRVEQFGGPEFVDPKKISEEERVRARDGVARALEVVREETYGLVILDEINVALDFGLISRAELESILDGAPPVELVCTGRNAPDWLIERADLVSEVRAVRHYAEAGVAARRGIEY